MKNIYSVLDNSSTQSNWKNRTENSNWRNKTSVEPRNSNGNYSNGNYSNGNYSRDRNSNGNYSNGNYSRDRNSNGNYSNGNYSNGNYSRDRNSNGNYSNGNYSRDRNSNGNYSNGNYSRDRNSNGNYSNGNYSRDRNSNGNYSNGNYTRKNLDIKSPKKDNFPTLGVPKKQELGIWGTKKLNFTQPEVEKVEEKKIMYDLKNLDDIPLKEKPKLTYEQRLNEETDYLLQEILSKYNPSEDYIEDSSSTISNEDYEDYEEYNSEILDHQHDCFD